MEAPHMLFSYIGKLLAFLPFFALLFILGTVKAALVGPLVFLIVLIGNSAVIIGLWPWHVFWTYYCVLKTKMFGPLMKGIMLFCLLIPILTWPVVGIISSFFTGLGYGVFSPLMATFEAVAEGVEHKFVRCFVDGTWSTVLGGCTIVRDFADVCFHSYVSYMDGLLESKNDKPTELGLLQIPGCVLSGIIGVAVDVPMITLIVIYKAPITLIKGWQSLLRDLVGRAGPFLETACVPFAGLLILLWPIVVVLATLAGVVSSFFLGGHAAFIAYEENSMKQGLLYTVSAISLFDEYTNDLLNMREGSCYPRPKYRKISSSRLGALPLSRIVEKSKLVHAKHPAVKMPSMKMQELKALVVWNNFFEACEEAARGLIVVGAIRTSDLEEWQHGKNKIINIGVPAYVFLLCFIRSVRSCSSGFVMRDGRELTSLNRPEGRVFDWFFEPMTIMKEQIKAANLQQSEEAYLIKLTLCCGNAERLGKWQNGGVPPADEVRRAQLEEISERLHGFALTMSRMPTFRRRFHEIVKTLMKESQQKSDINGMQAV